jgi:hypothetical protein
MKNHTYPYLRILANENERWIHIFLRNVELFAGSMAFLLHRSHLAISVKRPEDVSHLENLLRDYWTLSDIFGVRLPEIEWLLLRRIENNNPDVLRAFQIAQLWNLVANRHPLDHCYEILDLIRIALDNGGDPAIALETTHVAGGTPAIAMLEYPDSEYRPIDIFENTKALPPQPESPEMLLQIAECWFQNHKRKSSGEWVTPLRLIRQYIIAAALTNPSVIEHLIHLAMNLTPEECEGRNRLFEFSPGAELLTY